MNKPVNSGRVGCWIFETESRGEERSFEKQHNQILHGLVVLVGISLVFELLDDTVIGVEFQVLLGSHVTKGRVVSEGLSLHDSLHVGGPAVLGGDDTARRGDETLGNADFLNLGVKDVLHDLAQV